MLRLRLGDDDNDDDKEEEEEEHAEPLAVKGEPIAVDVAVATAAPFSPPSLTLVHSRRETDHSRC